MHTSQKGVPEPQAALDKVKIIENGDPLVDLRVFIPSLTFKEKLGNGRIRPFLRRPVAEMLRRASKTLAPHYNLHVTSALRDIHHQRELWFRLHDKFKAEHPHWPRCTTCKMVNKYAAPFDHSAPPGHTTGGAVDVVLQKPDGSFVDLVPPDLTDWSLGHTWTEKVNAETQKLRMLLLEAMLEVGFSNCRDEYWHYSWGDSGWAVRVGKTECPYGAVEISDPNSFY